MRIDRILEKLEWSLLTARLAQHAQTDEGQEACQELMPNLDPTRIEQRWSAATSLRDIARAGYKAPIGALKKVHHVLKSAEKGQILEGPDLRLILDLLLSTKRVLAFTQSFAAKSQVLSQTRAILQSQSKLMQAIETSVGPDGLLLDTASEELAAIRAAKTAVRKRIEDTIGRLMQDLDIQQYLQDDFYTVRNDKYVIPIRIDGRGRIKGTIIDTSDSGQTLFLEPTALVSYNQELRDIDVAEKLEMIRIFRELSAHVARDLDPLTRNYQELIELDRLTAEAILATEIDAGAVTIVDRPSIELIEARHPLIKTANGKTAEPNTIILTAKESTSQHVLVVSGPNAGGKTVVLKTVGLLHLMARAGLLIPAEPTSKMFIFEKIHLEMGDAQNITANLSTFSGHLLGLKPILESATARDLVLLDELATGTEPQTGAAIARAVIEHLANHGITTIATTHYDSLKSLAIDDPRYRNASMEYEESSYRPTYRLILDVPGQSYGLELATQMGLPKDIINRAKELRGNSHTALDEAVSALQSARRESERLKRELSQQLLDAQAVKARWENECSLLEQQRAKATRSVAEKLSSEVDSLRSEFEDKTRQLREAVKEIRTGHIDHRTAYDKKREAEAKLRELETNVAKMSTAGTSAELPGTPVSPGELKEGLNVYVLPLRKEGVVSKLGASANDPIEVAVGIIKVRVGILDLRKTRTTDKSPTQRPAAEAKTQRPLAQPPASRPELPEFVPQTAANTLDLRGSDADTAVEKTLNFIDRSMRSGEAFIVIIHGHGSDRLKSSIRSMLKHNCPYQVAYRPGIQGEGGDGVTVIAVAKH